MTNVTMVECKDVQLVARNKRHPGSVVIDGGRLSWSSRYNRDRVVNIAAADVDSLQWCRVDKNFQLTIVHSDSTNVFDGFREEDLPSIVEFGKVNGVDVESIKLATSGWNWGDCAVDNSRVMFKIGDEVAFDFPLADVAQTARQGKNEVSIEFHQDDTAAPDEDRLVEMRFYVPPLPADEVEGDEATRQERGVVLFHQQIQEKCRRSGLQEESIATFSEVLFVSPRGRYEVEMFGSYLTLHGKTFSYKIMYKSINRLFMLENPDKVTFVISLDPAIRQGGTTYSYLLLSFNPDDEIELRPNLSEEIIAEKYAGKLSAEMEGPVHDVVGRVFRALTGRKVIVSGAYRSHEHNKSVRCALKANDGFLFPLEKGLFFIHKPVMYIRYETIASIEFARVDAKSKSFDMIVSRRGGEGNLAFTQINREEYGPLLEFLRSRQVHIVNIANEEQLARDTDEAVVSQSGRRIRASADTELEALGEEDDEEEEDDEDFAEESEEELSDEYSSRSRASGDESGSAGESEDDEEAEDDEEEDEEPEDVPAKSKKSKQKRDRNDSAAASRKKAKASSSSKREAKRRSDSEDDDEDVSDDDE
ncbi:FACT complex subunit SSRP1 [Plasmodiophora brassicae]|uniref:FACT complex subunit SSRP1 n=2 Tax=Plasmodiophora brassicae TaxID=37360 RepID=A0A3P3Y3G5_PLABS|nr:unnamed protein product [Plasmodiophora brassicae]